MGEARWAETWGRGGDLGKQWEGADQPLTWSGGSYRRGVSKLEGTGGWKDENIRLGSKGKGL